jgi:hypothetical protein
MTTFEISIYPQARWNEETEDRAEHMTLGARGEVIASLEAEYPAAAHEAAKPTIAATASEHVTVWEGKFGTKSRRQVKRPAYAPGGRGTASWWTARGLAVLHPAAHVPTDD